MATLRDVYRSLFPDTLRRVDSFNQAPLLPADLFAFTAHLLERSGAYHHVAPVVRDLPDHGYRKILVDDAMRRRAIDIGERWMRSAPALNRRLPSPPPEVELLWQQLGRHQRLNVFTALDEDAPSPAWWVPCLELMMIADEASKDIGFDGENPFAAPVASGYIDEDLSTGRDFRRIQRAPISFSTAAEDLVCVQAKSRTPSTGCTLRSLSHHLALLPPRGQVRARWVQSPFDSASSAHGGLGLLLVPFPYRVDDRAFSSAGGDHKDRWGWFNVEQTWLPNDKDRAKRASFVQFILHLVEIARARGDQINGIILPELAINYVQFLGLARALARDSEIDFLISGISNDQNKRRGNFVAIAPFFLLGDERNEKITGWEKLILVREKHHRWKLNDAQLEEYGLPNLDRGKSWWENLVILSRSMDVLVYRGDTTLTTLICEDLARVDPCQAVVRAIGPNLLIALLMDGPQLGTRWAGRYATVLADDPGTSVLSLTSFGLIARQNDMGKHPQASSIALWKDEVQGVKSLELPREADALVLRLKSVAKTEHTLDGRPDGRSAHRWEYDAHAAVSIGAMNRPDWITTGLGR